MTPDAWICLSVLILTLALLIFSRIAPDIIMMCGATLLILAGVLDANQAFVGIGSPAVVTVGVLFIVAAGMSETGVLSRIGNFLLKRTTHLPFAQLRLMSPVMLLSAFLNNTPIVAMFIPIVRDFSRKCNLPVSKLMMPLSYASILGGTCTLIGTSTNLVVNDLIIAKGLPGLGFFDIAWVGLPCALLGLAYILFIGNKLLPNRRPPLEMDDDPREYTVEMVVIPKGPLVGKTIANAGLRHLPGLYLTEIRRVDIESIGRKDRIITAIAPDEQLQSGDQLVFVGLVDSIVDLQKIYGLEPAMRNFFSLDTSDKRRSLVEVVVSNSCQLLGTSIRDGKFRSVYGAAVIAAARGGSRINQKIGDIVLEVGDTLLIETSPSKAQAFKSIKDFFLVNSIDDSAPPRHEKAWLSSGIVLLMIILAATGLLSMFKASLLASGLMLATKCLTTDRARRSVDWSVLIVIAGAFGIGQSMQDTGLADIIANSMLAIAGESPWLNLCVIYIITVCLTEIITNNAAAILVFPIAYGVASGLNIHFMPFAIAIMIAASSSFSTPIGYQTNLMVLGPGGYRFTDYLRVGLPLNLLICCISLTLIPMLWPF